MSLQTSEPHLVWLSGGDLSKTLDASTWLKTTRELRNLGWRVTLVDSGSAPGGYKQVSGVELLCLCQPDIYLLRHIIFHLKFLDFVLRRFSTIDVVLFHELSAFWILPLRFVRLLKGLWRPLLVMDSRSLPMEPSDKGTWRDKIRNKVYLFANRLGNRYSDGRLAITRRMADAAQIPSNKLWGTWPSGADSEHFSSARINRIWPVPGTPVQLVYHGSLHYERNLIPLCRAVVRANAGKDIFRLTLIGEGTQQAELIAFASRTNGVVQVIGSVPYDDIPAFLAQAHIGVLPFPDEEKFRVSSPIKLFEYMAAGMPILATHIVCHTDVVGDDGYAFWAEEANEQGLFESLRLVSQSQDLLSGMGDLAFAASKSWTWKSAAKKLKKSLETGLENSSSDSNLRPHGWILNRRR